jgi:hypothetical protein
MVVQPPVIRLSSCQSRLASDLQQYAHDRAQIARLSQWLEGFSQD